MIASTIKNNPINCIEKDAIGRMWIGTGEGLFVGDLNGVQKINMGSTDSLEK
jgi:ligand-binding sensor domain-containing protein